MNNNFNTNEPSLNNQSAKFSNNIYSHHTILVKPCFEGRPYPCYESGFDSTIECPRVVRLEDMREGIEEHTDNEFYDLRGKQPLFYLQEMYGPDGMWSWNGCLLYTVPDMERARQVLAEHAEELNVILAFDDPDTGNYLFLIKTDAKDFTDKKFLLYRTEMDWELKQYFHHTIHHSRSFYVRACTEDHYDIVNRDALFKAPDENQPNEHVTPLKCESRTCRPESAGSIIKTFINRIFKIA